jgi:uncharacterized tellurite resistance protein B-like protein
MSDTPYKALNALAKLYIYQSAEMDAGISKEELKVIVVKMHEWNHEVAPQQLSQMVAEANREMSALKPDDKLERVNASLDLLDGKLNPNNKIALVQDLVNLAQADDDFDKNEKSFIRNVIERFQIDYAPWKLADVPKQQLRD